MTGTALEKDEIRVQYSGFVVFAAQIVSVATGLIFTLLLTRNMTKPEYGIWANIFDVLSYFLLLSTVFPFWTMRFVARQRQGAAKTGLLANLVTSLLFALTYISLTPIVTTALHISAPYSYVYVIVAAQIVNMHLIAALESVLRAKKPQAIGYGLLVEEVCKIVLAYLLIVGLQQLFLGAVLSLIFATAVQVLYYLKLTSKELNEKIQWNYAREWLKYSVINVYNAAGNQLAASTIILLFIYGGQAARGDYQAAITYANIVGYSLFLSYALYPRLLTKNSAEDVTSTLKTVLMFAIPMTTIAFSLPESLLTILNLHFNEATPVLMVLAIDAFVTVISQFYSSVILGAETLDQETTIHFRELVKSRIFRVFTLPYLQSIIALPTCFFLLTTYATGISVDAAVLVTAINLTAHVTTLAAQYLMMHNSVRVTVPWRSIVKYLFASAISALFFHVLPDTTTVVLTVLVVLAGSAIYASILLVIDDDTRRLVVAVWQEIKAILNLRASRQ
jgi:hypothetical protein